MGRCISLINYKKLNETVNAACELKNRAEILQLAAKGVTHINTVAEERFVKLHTDFKKSVLIFEKGLDTILGEQNSPIIEITLLKNNTFSIKEEQIEELISHKNIYFKKETYCVFSKLNIHLKTNNLSNYIDNILSVEKKILKQLERQHIILHPAITVDITIGRENCLIAELF